MTESEPTQDTPARPLAPTARTERILALDAARGLAILGVFCVNVQMMAGPLASLFEPEAPEGVLDTSAWAFTKIFCEGKFYPLFSMLFGMGFILLIDRVMARGRSPVPLYLRRVLILLVIGFLHLSLLWYGDILFLYSLCAIPLLFARKASARMLFILAGSFLALSVVAASVMTAMFAASSDGAPKGAEATTQAPAGQEQAEFVVDPDRPPVAQFVEGIKADGVIFDSYQAWAELETMAMRDGPYAQSTGMRLMQYMTFLFFFVPFGYGESVLAMFFLGAGLMRSKALENRKFLLTSVALGMAIGLPTAAGLTLVSVYGSQELAMALSPIGYAVFPLVSIMYLSALTLLAGSAAKHLPKLLAPVGRMALTNYLLDTLVLAILMQHWGFGLYATFSSAEMLGTVFGVFIFQIAFSHLWLSKFQFGPMEWVWRSLTYLSPQPLVRAKERS